MSEPPVTLDDLKKAIEEFARQEWDPYDAGSYEGPRADAWQLAFKWRDQFPDSWWTQDQDREYEEGMRLIREKLT